MQLDRTALLGAWLVVVPGAGHALTSEAAPALPGALREHAHA